MKTTTLFSTLLLITCLSGCKAQTSYDTSTTESNHRSSALSDSPAPSVHTTAGDFSRIVVVRLKHGTDLLKGLQEAIQNQKIKNAVILSGIGSLTQHHIHVVNNSSFPPSNTFVKQTLPSDLLNVNGYVIDGRVHAHITFSTDQKALGGHLEPDTKAFTFAIITLGVLDEPLSLQRFDDRTWR